MKLYVIFDTMANFSGQVMTFRNEALAIRTFTSIVKQNASIGKDLVLYYLGDYDDTTMSIKLASTPTVAVRGDNLFAEDA